MTETSAAVEPDEFYGLERQGGGLWGFQVAARHCSPEGGLFGGVGLAAAIEALEVELGQPLVWSAAQFFGFAPPDAPVTLELRRVAAGSTVVHAEALGKVGDEPILRVSAALGRRETGGELAGQWVTMPEVPGPDEAPPRPVPSRSQSITEAVPVRVASARVGDERFTPSPHGRTSLWLQPPLRPGSSAMLALAGDYLPAGLGQALGIRATSRSIDNTLRVIAHEPTEWVLVDVRMQSVQEGFAHGLAYLWSPQGRLLAIAGQTSTVQERAS